MTAPFLSSKVPYLRDGVTPAGSRIVCPRSERRFRVPVWVRYTSQFMVGPRASVCGVSAHPVLQGVLPGPRCVHELRLSLAPSSVLHCPVLWFSVASTTLTAGLGLSWVPCPSFCRLEFCSSVGVSTCSRWRPLPGCSSLKLRVLGGSWFSPLCSPGRICFQVPLLCSASCQQVVFWAWSLLLRVRLQPLPEGSLGDLWLPVRLL